VPMLPARPNPFNSERSQSPHWPAGARLGARGVGAAVNPEGGVIACRR
jgi:hypothetical protein